MVKNAEKNAQHLLVPLRGDPAVKEKKTIKEKNGKNPKKTTGRKEATGERRTKNKFMKNKKNIAKHLLVENHIL